MRTTSGRSRRDELDGLAPVGGLADDLDVGGRAQQHREAAAHERLVVGDRDPDHSGTPRTGAGDDAEPAAGRRAGRERAAVHADALAHAHEPVAAVGRAAVDAATVVGDLEPDRAGLVVDHRRWRSRRARVLQHVRQRLLHDAVRGEVDAGRHVGARRRRP